MKTDKYGEKFKFSITESIFIHLFINSIKRDRPIEVYRELDFTKMYSLPYKENILIKEYEPVIIEE